MEKQRYHKSNTVPVAFHRHVSTRALQVSNNMQGGLSTNCKKTTLAKESIFREKRAAFEIREK